MRKIVTIILVLFLFLLTGCDSHQDMNELGIVSALGVEFKDDEFILSAQLVNIKKSSETGGNSSSNVVTFVGNGKTLFECLRSITTKSSKKLYFAHLKMIIFDDSVLEGKENEIIDFFTRDGESMINYFIFASTDTPPSEILQTVTPFEEIPALYIVKLLKTSEKSYGNTYSFTFENYLDNLTTIGKTASFTKISLNKSATDETDSTDALKTTKSDFIELGNILVYDKSKKLTELSVPLSLSFDLLNNNIINPIITLPCNNSYYTSEVMSSRTSMNFKEKENKLIFNTNITLSISDYGCEYNLLEKENIKKLENDIKDYLEKQNNELLKLSQEYNNDFIGIGLFIKANYPNYFNFDKNDWSKEGLTKLKLKSIVNVNFEKRGNILNIVKKKGD